MSGDNMINEIMSKNIIFGNIDDTIKDIATLMKDNNIGFIPIKDKDEFVGVITDRDVCLSIVDVKSLDDTIKSYITNNIVYIDISSSIDDALDKMSKKKIKRLLVKDKDNFIGVLSLSDILNYTNNKNLITSIKTIFYIHNNNQNDLAEIDEFYL